MDDIIELDAKLVADRGFYYWLVSVRTGNIILGKKILLTAEEAVNLEKI